MVSLDNFILFDTPYSSCNNNDYIGSLTVRVFSSYYLLGANRLYSKQQGYWVLKAVLVNDKLITDYSFEDINILDEQILILSAFDIVVTVQWETLWEYFKLPSMTELNEISRQLTTRKIECYNNPLKSIYYKVLDEGKVTAKFEEWEVEMNNLFVKWKGYERVRLIDRGNSESWIEDFLNERTFQEFLTKYYNNDITFYSKEDVSESQLAYNIAIEEMRLSTGLGEELQVRNTNLPLSEYVDRMCSMYHSRLNRDAVVRYATIIHNYHNPVVEEVAEITGEVLATTTDQEEYNEALTELLENLNIDPSDILPLPTSTLEEYLDYLSDNVLVDGTGETFISIDTIDHYGTIVYNYHNGTQE